MANKNKKRKNRNSFVPKPIAHFEADDAESPLIHEYGESRICTTDGVGNEMPGARSPLDIVVDSSEGFVPLWGKSVVLRWAFDDDSLALISNSNRAKNYIRELLGEALLKWGDSAPVKFSENANLWDFKIRIEAGDNCNSNGACTLARAFFPDPGRNDLLLFPKMFTQSRKEQIDTLIHELGHVFGLRHFFANVRERAWPSEIFGAHEAFSIMNYGANSELTANDKDDLKRLYQLVWSGEINSINGTPIKFIYPYHENFSSKNRPARNACAG